MTRMHVFLCSGRLLGAVGLTILAMVGGGTVIPCQKGGIVDKDWKNRKGRDIKLQGRSMPLTLLYPDWDSAHFLAEVFKVVATHILGVNTITVKGAYGSKEALYQLAGCTEMSNVCTPKWAGSDYHIAFEAWYTPFEQDFLSFKSSMPDRSPLLTEVGYIGREGYFLKQSTQEAGLYDRGLALDHYRGYNVSWHKPWSFFDKISSVDSRDLSNCTSLKSSPRITGEHPQNYAKHTGDVAGVTNSGHFKCWNNHWFLSPPCRNAPDTCIPVIGDQAGNRLVQQMQLSFWNTMPLAFGVSKDSSAWRRIPHKHDVIFYWWIPDRTFITMKPGIVNYPWHNSAEYARDLYKTSLPDSKLYNLVFPDLEKVEPTIYEVIKRFRMTLSQMDEMILRKATNATMNHEDVACEWMNANEASWSTWIPDKRVCLAGRGLVTADGAFTDVLTDAKECALCKPGRFSVTVQDAGMQTRACKLCQAGNFANAHGSTSCLLCDVGRYTNDTGQTACNRCKQGKYQSVFGSTDCIQCNSSFVTMFLGAVTISDCVCPKGTVFEVASSDCKECAMEGLHCPGGHEYGDLNEDTSPLLLPGFMSLPEKPLEVYSCVSPKEHCPCRRSPFRVNESFGFKPYVDESCSSPPTMARVCAEGVQLSPRCAVCAPDHYKTAGKPCRRCKSTHPAANVGKMLFSFVLSFGFVVYMYFRFNIPQPAGYVVLGSVLAFMQLIGTVSVLPLEWPPELGWMEDIRKMMQIEGVYASVELHFECIAGGGFMSRLVWNSCAPLQLILMFVVLYLIGKVVPALAPNKPYTLNTISLIFSNFFVTISRMTLAIFTTDRMPNNLQMSQEFPEVEYGSGEWWRAMPISVLATIGYCVSFFAYVLHAALTAPRRAATEQDFCEQYRFMLDIMRPECWWWLLVSLTYSFMANFVQIASADAYIALYTSGLNVFFFIALEIYVRPFKFAMNNVVDIALKAIMLLLLTLCTAFVRIGDVKEMKGHQSRFAILAMILVICGFAIATVAFLKWALTLLYPPGAENGHRMKCAVTSRNVFAMVTMLPEREFISRLSNLCDADLQLLDSCSIMLVSAVLGMQPSESLLKQRVMPLKPWKIWSPPEMEDEVLDAAVTGKLHATIVRNADIRFKVKQLEERLMRKMEAAEDEGEEFTAAFSSQKPWRSGNAIKSTSEWASAKAHQVRAKANDVLMSYTATECHKLAAMINLTANDKTDKEAFICHVREALDITDEEARSKEMDLSAIFDTMDFNSDDTISMEEFATVMMGEAHTVQHMQMLARRSGRTTVASGSSATRTFSSTSTGKSGITRSFQSNLSLTSIQERRSDDKGDDYKDGNGNGQRDGNGLRSLPMPMNLKEEANGTLLTDGHDTPRSIDDDSYVVKNGHHQQRNGHASCPCDDAELVVPGTIQHGGDQSQHSWVVQQSAEDSKDSSAKTD